MNKPASLRAALVAALPALAAAPDQLDVFINEGSIAATGTRTPSFEYRYELEIIIRDFTGDADDVMIAVVEWVRANQPDLVTNPDQQRHGIEFVADILNNQAVDLAIRIKLTESIVVKTGDSGTHVVEHVGDAAEPWLT